MSVEDNNTVVNIKATKIPIHIYANKNLYKNNQIKMLKSILSSREHNKM